MAVVFPYSNDFSNRKLAFDATAHAIRTLAYSLNVHPRGIGEYQLEALERHPAKLIVVPSPHNFDDAAFARLLELARRGATVLWTGPIRLDAYWGPAEDRLRDELGPTVHGNVLREEAMALDGRIYAVSFGGRKIAALAIDRPASRPSGALAPVTVPLGGGRLIWCPLPLELNEREEPLAALYAHALREAGVGPELEWLDGGDLPGVYGRKLQFRAGSLYVFVSEYGADAALRVRDPRSGAVYAFTLERERSVLFAADAGGRLLAVYRPDEVVVRTE